MTRGNQWFRADSEKIRFVLLAFSGVDGDGLVGGARLFEKQRDFGGVWRSAVVEFQRHCLRLSIDTAVR